MREQGTISDTPKYNIFGLSHSGKKVYVFPNPVELNISSCIFKDDVKFIFCSDAKLDFNKSIFRESVQFEYNKPTDVVIANCKFNASTVTYSNDKCKLKFSDNEFYNDALFNGNEETFFDIKNGIVHGKGSIRVSGKGQVHFERKPSKIIHLYWEKFDEENATTSIFSNTVGGVVDGQMLYSKRATPKPEESLVVNIIIIIFRLYFLLLIIDLTLKNKKMSN